MDKRFMAIIAVIIAVVVGIAVFSNNKKDNDNETTGRDDSSIHTLGAGTSGVTLLEYGDYACPGCHTYAPVIDQVIEAYGDQISFQFRHYPLTNIHPNAYAAARAAEAASKQGKFWEMHKALFGASDWSSWGSNSTANGQPIFERYASTLGLDMTKFKEDFKGSSVNSAIRADMTAAERANVSSTPTFLINGKKVEVGASLDEFKTAIDKAIAENEKKS